MLVACRLAGLSALGVHYVGVKSRVMLGEAQYAYAGQGGYPVCRTSTVRGETPDGHDGGAGTRAAIS